MMNVLACNLGWGFNELLPGSQVSKLGKMKCQDADLVARDVKADDLRQMFLAMTEEVRVIIVKLADRLHNMRTLTHMSPHKQVSLACWFPLSCAQSCYIHALLLLCQT
jgi:hypothetical protein